MSRNIPTCDCITETRMESLVNTSSVCRSLRILSLCYLCSFPFFLFFRSFFLLSASFFLALKLIILITKFQIQTALN